jgi:murein DD-endopeptidase MepM/ murein hydrolase activator NlpD
MFRLPFSWFLLIASAAAAPLDLTLPTSNQAIFEKNPAGFYQFVDRTFEGEKSTPWEGGQFGFVRDPVRTPLGLMYKRFHEGIDIKPLHRDASGMPLDAVGAIAAGKVVYVNQAARTSNYGIYVVVEHDWGGCSYYSLYAHLNSVAVAPGALVKKGETLGVLGFTGAGIDRRRAHLHLELNLMLSKAFDLWHQTHFPAEPNRHGLFNGMNLCGLDVARLIAESKKNPALDIPGFLSREVTAFRVIIPGSPQFDLTERYPWLLDKSARKEMPSAVISFSQSGIPLKVAGSTETVSEPKIAWIKPSTVPYPLLTRGLVTGTSGQAVLSAEGKRYLQLFTLRP